MDSERRFKPVDRARKKCGVTRFLLVAPAQSESQAVVVGFIADGWVAVVAFVESQLEVKVGNQVNTERAVELCAYTATRFEVGEYDQRSVEIDTPGGMESIRRAEHSFR